MLAKKSAANTAGLPDKIDMPLHIQILITLILFLAGLLVLLVICGGNRCQHCNRHLDEEGKCIKSCDKI